MRTSEYNDEKTHEHNNFSVTDSIFYTQTGN